MTAIIRFKPLLKTDGEVFCSILEVDDSKILLDCGWDWNNWDDSFFSSLQSHAKDLVAIVISHPDINHLGGIAYAVGKLGISCPILATIPTYRMGQMCMYDTFSSLFNMDDFKLFSLDDVDAAFDQFQQLKFAQKVTIAGIELTPHAAGHTLGGSIWEIKKESETVVYAVDWNHKKERHLPPAWKLSEFRKPSVLITDLSALSIEPIKHPSRDLTDLIMMGLEKGGNVLLPTDSSARLLELSLVLDQHWDKHKSDLAKYTLVVLTNVAFNTFEFAKSQLEWMNDSILNAFESSRENAFAFKFVRLCHDLDQLGALSGQLVVLSSLSDLSAGYSRQLFHQFAEKESNMLIFTERSKKNSLATKILNQSKLSGGKPFPLDFELKQREYLSGAELEEYLRVQEEERRALEEQEQAQLELDQEDEDESALPQTTFQPFQDGTYDMRNEQFGENGLKFPMFPFTEKRKYFDEYGQSVIEVDDFQFEDTSLANQVNAQSEFEEDGSPMEVDRKEEKPSKIVSTKQTLTVRCTIGFINYEGRADSKSLQSTIQTILPRKLVLLNGEDDVKQSMKEWSSKNAPEITAVLTPAVDEKVEITTDTNIFKIKLKDSFLNSIKLSQIGDYKVAYVDGKVSMKTEIEPNTLSTSSVLPILTEAPSEQQNQGHKALFLGDVKLADFREVLRKEGFRAELFGGVLLTLDGNLALKKEIVNGLSTIRMEGTISADYFKIRTLLYAQFSIL